jgi:hypothetical protein
MADRVTQVVAEVLQAGDVPYARVTQVVAEVLQSGDVGNIRVTQVVAEVLMNVGMSRNYVLSRAVNPGTSRTAP